MDSMLTMLMKSMEDAQKQRDHEFKMAQLKQQADERANQARAEADKAAMVRAKELELEAIKAKAASDQAIAAENAKWSEVVRISGAKLE